MLNAQVIANGLITGSIYVIAALGFNLIYGTTGTFHIAYGPTVLVAVYVATMVGVSGTGGYLGLLLGVVAAMLIGAIVYVAFYHPLERLGRSRTIVFVASLGLATLLEAVMPWVWKPAPRNFNLPWLLNARDIIGLALSPLDLIAIFGALVMALVLWAILRWSKFGRNLRGIAVNPLLGEVMGMRRVLILTTVFAVGSALGFVGITMMTMSSAVTPDVGVTITLIAAIVVLAGGMGSLMGSYVIGLMFGLIQEVSTVYVPARWSPVLVYAAFTIIILARPTGLLHGFSRSVA
jgi:branched-chain amino acid transport system permease protein